MPRVGVHRAWLGISGCRVLSLLLGFAATGCSEREIPSGNPGIPEFRIAPDPTTVIGDGDERYQFYRIVSVAALGDGSVVVADGGTQEIRVFSGSGQFLRTLSRGGDGPGELTNITGMGVDRDTIIVFEGFPAPPQRHLFHPVHGFLSRMRLQVRGVPAGISAVLAVSISRLLVTRGARFRVATPPPVGELRRDSIELGLWRYDRTQSVRWLGQFPDNTWFSFELPTGRRFMDRYSLGPSLVSGTSGGKVWIGDGGSGVIHVFDSTANVVAQFELLLPRRAFDESALEQARQAALSRVPERDVAGRRAWVEGLYDPQYRPAAIPRFVRFVPGPRGEMWVESYSEVATDRHAVAVLDSVGRQIGKGTVPTGVVPYVLSEDRLIGVHVDSLGVERVVIHEVTR